jgi:hypothetical protein
LTEHFGGFPPQAQSLEGLLQSLKRGPDGASSEQWGSEPRCEFTPPSMLIASPKVRDSNLINSRNEAVRQRNQQPDFE